MYNDYPEVFNIAEQQGWSDQTVLQLTLGWLKGQLTVDAMSKLVTHLKTIQEEENEQCLTS